MGVREEVEKEAINALRLALCEYTKTMRAAGGTAVYQTPRVSEFIGIMAIHQADGTTEYQFASFGNTEDQKLRDHEARGLVDILQQIASM